MHPDTRPLPSPRATVALLLLALLAAIALGAVARGGNVLEWDVHASTAIQRAGGRSVEVLADIGNTVGSTLVAAIAIALSIVIAAVRRAWPETVFLSSLLILRLLATQTKPIFSSPRPTDDIVTIIGEWDGTGFPSGHALTASTMALGLAVIAWKRLPSRPLAITTVGILIAFMFLVGWARVWTGAHWATDVLGGYLFGLAIVAASLVIMRQFAPADRHP